ncbi:MAG TPA: 5-formyltetrahydrofolate cyclo-ligase, partial [Cyclobacteriaceae bacterium]|nr:5-formyltetrahydrofolate cyclo-ligase [Cyclobacteriaceae bacterium]
MKKAEIRELYSKKRLALSEAEYSQLNFQLYQVFFSQVDLSFIKAMHVFLPISSKKEVDTWLIIDRIRREFPHIRLVVPKVNSQSSTL